jgi:hypothetical protein
VNGITITDTHMTSPDTPHTAIAVDGGWRVSWLPGRALTRNQATTAMVIATIVGGRGVGLSDDPIWAFLDSWATELGLSGSEAVVRVSEPLGVREDEASTEPEAGGER